MNMNYCVFENTEQDLRQALEKLRDDDAQIEDSRHEVSAKARLLLLYAEIAEEFSEEIEKIKNAKTQS